MYDEDAKKQAKADRTRRQTMAALLGGALAAGTAQGAEAATRAGTGGELVAFLTRSGNTRVFAGALSRQRGADLFEIRTRIPYPDDYEAHVQLADAQRQARATPPLAETVTDIARYRTVFLGFPVWATDLPAPLRSFLVTHDLAGKTVVPVVTHGGYGAGSSLDTLRALAPQARILPAFVQECDQERRQLRQLRNWFAGIAPGLPPAG